MNVTERERLAAAIVALRPDWANPGKDKTRSIRTFITEKLALWSLADAAMAAVAACVDPDARTPAAILEARPHRAPAPRRTGPDCAQCGAPAAGHTAAGHRAGCPGYQPDTRPAPTSPQIVTRARQIRQAHQPPTPRQTPEDRF